MCLEVEDAPNKKNAVPLYTHASHTSHTQAFNSVIHTHTHTFVQYIGTVTAVFAIE